jgi:hypothetical protein
MIVDASDLLCNGPLDAMMLERIEVYPGDDGPSCAEASRAFNELAIAWWLSEGGAEIAYPEAQ